MSNRRIQIGFDASRLAVAARTGTEHYSWEVLAALGQIDRRNSYTLYCNRRPQALPPLPTNYVLRPMPLPRAWTHLRLSLEMLRLPPDVLFVPAHALPLLSAPRSVVTIHDLGFLRFPEAHTRGQRLYHRVFTRLSAARATRIIAISEATRRDLATFYGTPTAKMRVVYHGVDARFRPQAAAGAAEVARRYGIDTSYLLFVSTVQPRKNVARLIEAFAVARARLGQHCPLRLVLAGKRGWMTEQIERRAAALGIENSVSFLGYVDNIDLPALLAGALAYVVPSLYEGFGMTALEAMACGTPVLASNTSSLPEVVGDAGLLVDPLDTQAIASGIQQLAEDAALRDELRERGLRRVAGWTWQRCARQTLEVLEQAAG